MLIEYSCHMQRLPIEILFIIFDYLKSPDLDNLDATSRKLHIDITAYKNKIFKTKYPVTQPEKLAKLLGSSSASKTHVLIRTYFAKHSKHLKDLKEQALTEENTVRNIWALCCYLIVSDRKNENFSHLSLAYKHVIPIWKDYIGVARTIENMHETSPGNPKRESYYVAPNYVYGAPYTNFSYSESSFLRLLSSDFSHANFRHSKITCSVEDTNFSYADFSYAQFIDRWGCYSIYDHRCSLKGTRFKGAIFKNTQFFVLLDDYSERIRLNLLLAKDVVTQLTEQMSDLHRALAGHEDEMLLKDAAFNDLLRLVKARPAEEKIPLLLAAYASPLFKHYGYLSLRAKVNSIHHFFYPTISPSITSRDMIETIYQSRIQDELLSINERPSRKRSNGAL